MQNSVQLVHSKTKTFRQVNQKRKPLSRCITKKQKIQHPILIFNSETQLRTCVCKSHFISSYLATAIKANSTFCPLFAEVSMKATLYSLASLSPSSLLTALSDPQSALFPANTHAHIKISFEIDLARDSPRNKCY